MDKGSVGPIVLSASLGLRALALKNPQRGLISAQNISFLRRFVTEQGKILSRRFTRVTARQQRELTKAIKQARILGYLKFVNTK
jgi:small subunit ribosomal protein S18